MPLYKTKAGQWRCDQCDQLFGCHTQATLHRCVPPPVLDVVELQSEPASREGENNG